MGPRSRGLRATHDAPRRGHRRRHPGVRPVAAPPPPRGAVLRDLRREQRRARRLRAVALVRGFCIGFGVAVWETMVMELVPEHLLSRVVSLDYFGSFGLMPVGLAVWAAFSGLAAPGTLIAVGAGISSVLFLAALTRPWIRAID